MEPKKFENFELHRFADLVNFTIINGFPPKISIFNLNLVDVSNYFIQQEKFVFLKNGHWDPQIQIKNSNFGRETIYYSKFYKVRKSMQFKIFKFFWFH